MANFDDTSFKITGKNIELGEALQNHIKNKTKHIFEKYIGRPTDINIVILKSSNHFNCEMTTHLSSGVYLTTNSDGHDAYNAFDVALEKLEKRIRRHTKKLKNHNRSEKKISKEKMATYIIASQFNSQEHTDVQYDNDQDQLKDESTPQEPLIIAEISHSLLKLPVNEAVFQLEMIDEQVFVFRNSNNNRINMVYERNDGNIGWIDPTDQT